MNEVLTKVAVPGLQCVATGKVRDVFALRDLLLMVTSDRISAYDSVMPNGIPDKGRVLTQISRFWFRRLRPILPHHLVTCDDDYIAALLREHGVAVTEELRRKLRGRCMLAVQARIFPVECVVRGYISGSLWAEYTAAGGPSKGAVLHGHPLPPGLKESDRLPEPIFTPATKEASGHDVNISLEQTAAIVGRETAAELCRLSIALYVRAAEQALRAGIIIADTKFEFGTHNGVITLCDEALTPDSSRFWDAAAYAPGRAQPSFDKQYLRDWLTSSGWNREPPPPPLPPDVVEQTAARYREAYRRITGTDLQP